MLNFEQRVRDAGGSVVEALHHHKCGPNCMHRVRFDVSPETAQAAAREGARSLMGGLVKMAAAAIRKKI